MSDEYEHLDLIRMPHDYDCGAFNCGISSVNEALRGELLDAIREGRTRAYYLEHYGKCIGFFALRAESFDLTDSIDRDRAVHPLSRSRVPGVLLELIGVDESVQKHGVGKRLVLTAVGFAQEVAQLVGARFLVLESLPGAVGFYQNLSFKRTLTQTSKNTTFMILDLLEL